MCVENLTQIEKIDFFIDGIYNYVRMVVHM